MSSPQQVIDEARPMLEEFLNQIGLHREGTPLDFEQLLEPFSIWVDAQQISEADRWFLVARLGAFICEYLTAICSAEYVIADGRIMIRVPIQEGILREFDPYAMANGIATNRTSLKEVLDSVC